jgi:hypothetical protein
MGGELLLLLAVHLVLTGLPGVASVLFAARRGVRQVPLLLAIGLVASGVVAMLAFWAYYADRQVGETFAFLVAFGSLLAAGWSLWGGRIDPLLLRRLSTPLALWALGSVFLVFLGFLHGGAGSPLEMSTARFSHQLPADNYIPNFFSKWFYLHGHHGRPPLFFGEWLASDRPPLQIGYVLSQRPLGWPGSERLNYEILGVVLQQLWIVGLWALLLAARVGRVTRLLAMVTVLVSDLAIVNGFYVWPKLLPAAMLLGAAALMLTPLWADLRRSLWAAALVAALLGLALLGHGSSVFGVIALALVAALRGLPSWRWIGVAALVGVAVLAPWSAYQKYGDPPGNRLTKWMAAGVTEADGRSSATAVLDAYGEAGLGGTIHHKGQNLVTMVGGGPMVDHLRNAVDAVGDGDVAQALREVRLVFFFNLLPSLGLLLVAPLAMLAGRRRARLRPAEWRFALTCFATLLLGAVAWGLLLFGNVAATTVIHQGSYLLPILGLVGAVAGLRATFPRFAIYYAILSAALMLALYVPALDTLPGSSYSFLAALLAVAGLAGFCAVAAMPDDDVVQGAPLSPPIAVGG